MTARGQTHPVNSAPGSANTSLNMRPGDENDGDDDSSAHGNEKYELVRDAGDDCPSQAMPDSIVEEVYYLQQYFADVKYTKTLGSLDDYCDIDFTDGGKKRSGDGWAKLIWIRESVVSVASKVRSDVSDNVSQLSNPKNTICVSDIMGFECKRSDYEHESAYNYIHTKLNESLWSEESGSIGFRPNDIRQEILECAQGLMHSLHRTNYTAKPPLFSFHGNAFQVTGIRIFPDDMMTQLNTLCFTLKQEKGKKIEYLDETNSDRKYAITVAGTLLAATVKHCRLLNQTSTYVQPEMWAAILQAEHEAKKNFYDFYNIESRATERQRVYKTFQSELEDFRSQGFW